MNRLLKILLVILIILTVFFLVIFSINITGFAIFDDESSTPKSLKLISDAPLVDDSDVPLDDIYYEDYYREDGTSSGGGGGSGGGGSGENGDDDDEEEFIESILMINESLVMFGSGSVKINWLVDSNLGVSSASLNIYYPNGDLLYNSNAFSGEVILSPENLSLIGVYSVELSAIDVVGNHDFDSGNFYVLSDEPIFTIIPENTTIFYGQSWEGVDFDAGGNM